MSLDTHSVIEKVKQYYIDHIQSKKMSDKHTDDEAAKKAAAIAAEEEAKRVAEGEEAAKKTAENAKKDKFSTNPAIRLLQRNKTKLADDDEANEKTARQLMRIIRAGNDM
jgi:hypothetical protein